VGEAGDSRKRAAYSATSSARLPHSPASNIADVLLTLEYTALNSFDYRQKAIRTIDDPKLSKDRPFSFRQQFPTKWVRPVHPDQTPILCSPPWASLVPFCAALSCRRASRLARMVLAIGRGTAQPLYRTLQNVRTERAQKGKSS
jgi:hypothetical protein